MGIRVARGQYSQSGSQGAAALHADAITAACRVNAELRLIAVQAVSAKFCKSNSVLPVQAGGSTYDGHIASVVTSDRPPCDGSRHPHTHMSSCVDSCRRVLLHTRSSTVLRCDVGVLKCDGSRHPHTHMSSCLDSCRRVLLHTRSSTVLRCDVGVLKCDGSRHPCSEV